MTWTRSNEVGDDERDDAPPDYESLVERQLRIADGERAARTMWAEILSRMAAEGRRQKYIYVRRKR